MTDEERYPPPYETKKLAEFRKEQLPARESIRARGLEFHRHYAGSTACTPSRATLFTGQYPSLHGVDSTDGTAKQNSDPGMHWLDPNSVPTLGGAPQSDSGCSRDAIDHASGPRHGAGREAADPETPQCHSLTQVRTDVWNRTLSSPWGAS
jgi:Sulfatase